MSHTLSESERHVKTLRDEIRALHETKKNLQQRQRQQRTLAPDATTMPIQYAHFSIPHTTLPVPQSPFMPDVPNRTSSRQESVESEEPSPFLPDAPRGSNAFYPDKPRTSNTSAKSLNPFLESFMSPDDSVQVKSTNPFAESVNPLFTMGGDTFGSVPSTAMFEQSEPESDATTIPFSPPSTFTTPKKTDF